MIRRITHLYSRWVAMGETPRLITTDELRFVRGVLLPSEFALWTSMDRVDQQHSLDVARNFMTSYPQAERAEISAALLHDVGKAVCVLHRNARVVATLGSFNFAPFRWYRAHERNGARTLQHIGSDKRTVLLVAGRSRDPVAKALRAADNAAS